MAARDRSTPSVALVEAAGTSRMFAPGAAAPAQEAANVASAWSLVSPGSEPFGTTWSGAAGRANAARKAATSLLFTLLRAAMAMVWPLPSTPADCSASRCTSLAASSGVRASILFSEVLAASSAAETASGCGVVNAGVETAPSSETSPLTKGRSAAGTEISATSTARVPAGVTMESIRV